MLSRKALARALSGIFPVYKPRNVNSTAVVAAVRRTLETHFLSKHASKGGAPTRTRRGQKPLVKVGHGGTLDPLAEGVLVIGVGDGCRDLSCFLQGAKAYSAVGKIGERTDTGDITGEVIETCPLEDVSLEQLKLHLKEFEGDILQAPPLYSAVKRGGKRMYEYARDGTTPLNEIPLPAPRPIHVYNIGIVPTREVRIGHTDCIPPDLARAFEMSSSFLAAPNENGDSDPSSEMAIPYFGLKASVGGGT